MAIVAAGAGGDMVLRLGFGGKTIAACVTNDTLGRRATKSAADMARIAARTQVSASQGKARLDVVETNLFRSLLRRRGSGDGDDRHRDGTDRRQNN